MTTSHPKPARTRLLAPVAAVLCLLLALPEAARAQDIDLDVLFPRSLAGLQRVDAEGEIISLILTHEKLQGSVPGGRYVASYSDGTTVRLLVDLMATGRAFAALFGSEDEAVLALAERGGPMSVLLSPATAAGQRVFRGQMDEVFVGFDGSVAADEPESTEIMVVPLGGHAVLRLEDLAPQSASGDRLAGALTELDIGALRAAAAGHAEVGRHLWDVIASLPASVADRQRNSMVIERNGHGVGPTEIVVASFFGQADAMGSSPEFAVVAAAMATTETTASETMGITEDLQEGRLQAKAHGDRTAYLSRGREPRVAVLEDHAALMLFSSSPNISNTELEALLATIDIEPFFRAAAAYRAAAPTLTASAGGQP